MIRMCNPVVRGGRRLTQLNVLVDAGSIDADYLVPVKVLTESEAQSYATEISQKTSYVQPCTLLIRLSSMRTVKVISR